MDFLRRVAVAFISLMQEGGTPVAFQIGEPWWWTTSDGRIALYDSAARALFGDPIEIADVRSPLAPAQTDLLDRAGQVLAASTAALTLAVRSQAPDAKMLLLLFTPTALAADMPELKRANVPIGWRYPAFDRLQLEDYDWLTAGNEGARRAAYALVDERLGYSAADQDYLAGFVPDPAAADPQWRAIDAALDDAAHRAIGRRFVWALPQVARDGFTRLPSNTDPAMQAFDDVLYPLALGRDAGVSAEFSTSVSITASGHERRASHWSDARLHFDVGPGVRSEEELATLIAFFRARRGAARAFRLRDPFDFSSNGASGVPTAGDQLLGIGDGRTVRFPLVKRYAGPDDQVRPITRPRPESIIVSVGGAPVMNWEMAGAAVILAEAPPAGAGVRAGFLFDVPVRFASDRLDVNAATFAAGEAPSVLLVEVREAA